MSDESIDREHQLDLQHLDVRVEQEQQRKKDQIRRAQEEGDLTRARFLAGEAAAEDVDLAEAQLAAKLGRRKAVREERERLAKEERANRLDIENGQTAIDGPTRAVRPRPPSMEVPQAPDFEPREEVVQRELAPAFRGLRNRGGPRVGSLPLEQQWLDEAAERWGPETAGIYSRIAARRTGVRGRIADYLRSSQGASSRRSAEEWAAPAWAGQDWKGEDEDEDERRHSAKGDYKRGDLDEAAGNPLPESPEYLTDEEELAPRRSSAAAAERKEPSERRQRLLDEARLAMRDRALQYTWSREKGKTRKQLATEYPDVAFTGKTKKGQAEHLAKLRWIAAQPDLEEMDDDRLYKVAKGGKKGKEGKEVFGFGAGEATGAVKTRPRNSAKGARTYRDAAVYIPFGGAYEISEPQACVGRLVIRSSRTHKPLKNTLIAHLHSHAPSSGLVHAIHAMALAGGEGDPHTLAGLNDLERSQLEALCHLANGGKLTQQMRQRLGIAVGLKVAARTEAAARKIPKSLERAPPGRRLDILLGELEGGLDSTEAYREIRKTMRAALNLGHITQNQYNQGLRRIAAAEAANTTTAGETDHDYP